MRNTLGAALVVFLAASAVSAQDEKRKEPAHKLITGQCHCGQIKYQVQGAILRSNTCKCRGCQRATATLEASFVTVLRTAFTVTAGKLTVFRSRSRAKCDAHGEWRFCSKCGTQISWRADQGKELDIFAGTLDDTSLFQPKK